MAKPWYYYLLMTLAFLFVIFFSFASFPQLTSYIPLALQTLIATSIHQDYTSVPYNDSIDFGPGAPKSDFAIEVNEIIRNCFLPETDSSNMASKLDSLWRDRWASFYRHGCWAPTFSTIHRSNNTLVIDCGPTMKPKYGFRTRSSLQENYIGPVSMGNHEWVYARCSLPFYSAPTTRLHFYAQPLPPPSPVVKQKANVVFMQFDALGRQAMYRRMPRSYKLLTSYEAGSKTVTTLRGAMGIELRHLNVNGRNSEPNMRMVYCGSGNCQNTSLLRLYKQAGYSTSLLESYSYQLPNYIPFGAVDRVLASNYFREFGGDTTELYHQRSGCVAGTTWIADEMFDYLRDRFIAMRVGGWFSLNNMVDPHSIDELNNYAILDTKFHEFLLALNKSEALDNTILIVLADHGLHGYDWKELWREFDQRNPPLYILIGRNVTGSARIVKHLQANSDKLVSHADIYMTFARFANVSLPLVLPKTYNLFTENISSNRTCRTARIPDEWCNCWRPKPKLKPKPCQ